MAEKERRKQRVTIIVILITIAIIGIVSEIIGKICDLLAWWQ